MTFTRETARAAGLKRAKQFTAESQSRASRAQSSETKAKAGKRGAAACIQKYGREFFFNKVVANLKAHPTTGEIFLASILTELGISYEFNAPLEGKWIVDFLIGEDVIEFNGTMHASKFYDTAQHERKIAGLKASGRRVLEIDDAGLATAADTIREFLGVSF